MLPIDSGESEKKHSKEVKFSVEFNQGKQQKTRFDELPNEIIQAIIQFIPPQHSLPLSLLSHQVRNVWLETPLGLLFSFGYKFTQSVQSQPFHFQHQLQEYTSQLLCTQFLFPDYVLTKKRKFEEYQNVLDKEPRRTSNKKKALLATWKMSKGEQRQAIEIKIREAKEQLKKELEEYELRFAKILKEGEELFGEELRDDEGYDDDYVDDLSD